MTSRFFATGDTSSSSDSDSDVEANVDEIQRRPTKIGYRIESDDEVDDGKREVKSKKQKQNEAIEKIVNKIRNKRRIGDWNSVQDAYAELNTVVEKQRKITKGPPTKLYLKCAVDLEDSVAEAWSSRKSLNKLVAKALGSLKQKISRYNRDNKLQELIEEYRANPVDDDDDEEEEVEAPKKTVSKDDSSSSSSSSSESSDDEDEAPKKEKAPVLRKALGSDDESDSDFWASDGEESDSSSDSSEDDEVRTYTAADFLKTNTSTANTSKRRTRRQTKPKVQVEKGDEDEFILNTRFKPREKQLFKKDEEINVKAIVGKLETLHADRGKKGSSVTDQLTHLNTLRGLCAQHNLGHAISLKVLLHIIAAHFDEPASLAGYIKPAEWKVCQGDIMELLAVLMEHPEITVTPHLEEHEENLDDKSKPLKVRGNVVAFVERLDDEYVKSLQNIDPHTTEYVDRLKDEVTVYNLIVLCQQYCVRIADKLNLHNIVLRRIEHIYYKRDHVPAKEPTPEEGDTRPRKWVVDDAEEADISALVHKLCATLYGEDAFDRHRARAMLCNIYQHALMDRWYEARDLMLMSHLQETIQHSDVATQILYNRTMVQLGLCAFRNGMIQAAHTALHDIWAGSRVKELLAQGIGNQRWNDKSQEEVKLEKRRQIPFHMHINIELLECVYYVCSMLLEIPHLARGHAISKRVISKPFRRQLDFYTRQIFNGPPENTRDHVMAGSLAMQEGNWAKCSDLITGLKIWNLMPNAEDIKTMLTGKIQEESLRTYLFAHSGFYESLSLVTLAEMFNLEEKKVHSLVSKMIISEELQASHDQPTKTIVIHKHEPSALQRLALEFADKVGIYVENNERLLDMCFGGYGYKDKQQWQHRGNSNRRDNRNYHNRRDGQRGGNRDQRGGNQRGGNRDQRGGNRDQRGGYQKNYQRNNNRY